MAGLIFILPILAFDVWLSVTTGKRQVRLWIEKKQWRQMACAAGIGLLLAVLLPFFVKFTWGKEMRAEGFPVPLTFFHLDNKYWLRSELPLSLIYVAAATDILTGLAAPFIPYKIAEFLKAVKAELK